MTTISREELYEQVWAKPMTTVARGFGVTSTALKKTCKHHQVPTPERGYWARLAHGKHVAKKPLPKLTEPRLAKINIRRRANAVPDVARKAREEALIKIAGPSAEPAPAIDLTEPAVLTKTRRGLLKARPDALASSRHMALVSYR